MRCSLAWASLSTIWLLLPAVVVFVVGDLLQVMPHDFWWHVRTGQIILASHAVPVIDSFTFTRSGFPWTNEAWLMQVILYLLYAAGGLPLVIFAVALTVAGGYALIEAAAYAACRGHARAAAAATMVAAAVSAMSWGARPEAVSFLCYGALVWLLQRHDQRGGRCLWAAPLLFAVWVNLHGAFAFGILLLGVYVASKVVEEALRRRRNWFAPQVRCSPMPDPEGIGPRERSALRRADGAQGTPRLARSDTPNERSTEQTGLQSIPFTLLPASSWSVIGAGVASLVALCINPTGPAGIVCYVLGFFQSKTTQFSSMEFMPLSVREQDGAAFFAAVLALLLLLYVRRLRLRPHLIAAMIVLGLFTLYARRGAPWFAMAAVPAFAVAFAPLPGKVRQREKEEMAAALEAAVPPTRGPTKPERSAAGLPAANVAVLAVLVFCALASLPWLREALPIPAARRVLVNASQTPLTAATVLCGAGQDARLFNSMSYGSYLEWACPGLRVFIDTRIELYPTSLWQDYFTASSAQFGWEKVFSRYGINTVLISKQEQGPLVEAVKGTGRWQTVYEDQYALLARLR